MEWINSIEGIKAWWLTNANPQNSQHNAFLTNSLKNISKGVDVKVAKLGEDLVIVSMRKGNVVPQFPPSFPTLALPMPKHTGLNT